MKKKLKAAILGFGGMGHCHASQYAEQKDCELVAVCDINPAQLEKTDITINLGNSGKTNVCSLRKYLCYEELIRNEPDLDYIDICLPSDLHAEYAIRAMNDGFNVLCEKPMALNLKDADAMIAASEKTGKLLMIAQCLRFSAEFNAVREAYESGKYGKLLRLDMRRVGGLPGGWFRDVKRSGGALLDLHLHDADFINSVFGMPDSVMSYGTDVYSGGIDDSITIYFYGDLRIPYISSEGSWARSRFSGQLAAVFEKATIEIGTPDGTVIYSPEKGTRKLPLKVKTNPYFNEIAYFAKCVKSGKQPELATPWSTRESLRLIFAEERSARTAKKVRLQK